MRRSEDTVSSERATTPFDGDHEVFNQFRGVVLLFSYHVDHLLIHHDRLQFAALEVERAMAEALILERLRNRVLQFELRRELARCGHFRRSWAGALKPCPDRVIGKLCPVADHGAIKVAGAHVAICAHNKLDHDAKKVFVFEQ